MSSEPFIPRITTGVLFGSFNPFGGSSSSGGGNGGSSRESHVFCGVCCNVHCAVLIVNAITMVFHFILMMGLFVGFGFLSKNRDTIVDAMDDDFAKKQFENFANNRHFKLVEGLVAVFFIISIALHGCGIYGAFKFELWGIVTAAVNYAISLLFGIISFNLLHVIIAALFLYPHVVMIQEMKEGIVTEDNYSSVSVCCFNI